MKLANFLQYSKVSKKIKKIGFAVFSSSLSIALVLTVWSLYINSFLKDDALVGITSAFLVFLSFISYFFIIPLVEKSDKLKLCIIASLVTAICYLFYAIADNFYLFLLSASIVAIVSTIRISSLGILVEKNSKKRNLSKDEGFIYTLLNSAYLIGPLIGGFVLAKLGARPVFVFASLIFAIGVAILSRIKVHHGGKKKKIDSNIFKNFIDFFKDKDRLKGYLIGCGISFWWSLVYIYIPLLIIRELQDYWVGIYLAAVVIPLITLEYYFSIRVSEKGYKKVFFIGFLIPAILALICFLFFNIWVVLICTFLASIGLAMVEPATETYFFDISRNKEDQRFYAPYNTRITVGQVFGQFVPSLLLFVLSFKYILLVYFAGMLILSLLSFKIKDVIEKKRKR